MPAEVVNLATPKMIDLDITPEEINLDITPEEVDLDITREEINIGITPQNITLDVQDIISEDIEIDYRRSTPDPFEDTWRVQDMTQEEENDDEEAPKTPPDPYEATWKIIEPCCEPFKTPETQTEQQDFLKEVSFEDDFVVQEDTREIEDTRELDLEIQNIELQCEQMKAKTEKLKNKDIES